MAKKNENRVLVSLKCTECKEANYTVSKNKCGRELRPVSKNKKNNPERLELKRYCAACHKHVVAKEKK